MPPRNRIKQYIDDGYYHVYNRGVNKGAIFTSDQDYRVFLSYLKSYLLPKDTDALTAILADQATSQEDKATARNELKRNNFSDKIELVAYCLMPNHYHLLLHTKSGYDLKEFMLSCMTRYTGYFNHLYKRIGPLYQDRYKAVLVQSIEQLLYLTHYIHRNILPSDFQARPETEQQLLDAPSSYAVYMGKIKQEWVHPEIILDNFGSSGFTSYQAFVQGNEHIEENLYKSLPHLVNLDSTLAVSGRA